MTDETPEQIAVRVLGEQLVAEYGEDRQTWAELGSLRRVAAVLAAELRAGGWLVEGEMVTEEMYASPDFKRLGSVKYVKAGHIDPQGMRLVSRQRTRYPDHVTEWEVE